MVRENKAEVSDALKLLDTLRPEDIRAFVETLINEDQAILAKFLRRFGSVDLAGLKADLLYDLRQAEKDNSYYGDGFIDRRNSSFFEDDIFQCVDNHVDVLVDRGEYESALILGSEVYLFLTQVDVDDSDGFTFTMLETLDETWDDIYHLAEEQADDCLFRLLFTKLNEYVTDETIRERAYSDDMGDEVYYLQCKHIEEYIVKRFSDVVAYAPYVQEMADKKLQVALRVFAANEAERERNGIVSYRFDRSLDDIAQWVLVRLRCMRTMGASYEELLAFARDYLSRERVCLYLVNERKETGDYEEALHLLQTVLDDAAVQERQPPVWALRHAIGLFELTNDTAAVRNLLEQLVVTGAYDAEATEWFLKLKGMCTQDEWDLLRETIFTCVSDDRPRWRYYAAEGLYDRLMDEVEAKGLWALHEFEHDLAAHYPERVLALYENDLMGKDGKSPRVGSSRNVYANFADSVNHLRSIEGGDEVANRIIDTVLSIYPRRPALREELGRA